MSYNDEVPKLYKDISNNNYLSNCYMHLTKIKEIHFLLLLIEILLNIFKELEIFLSGYKMENLKNDETGLNFVSYITNSFDKIPTIIKFLILVVYIILFDLLHVYVRIKKIKIKSIIFTIIVNLLELIISRTFMLIFLNLFFTLKNIYVIVGLLFLLPHLYLNMYNFLYNHLYFIVPLFINYPYDEFSSIFDITLLFIKLFLSIGGSTNNSDLGKFCLLIVFVGQIFFSFYFFNKLRNNSFLFMKNSFLNKSKVCLFFCKTIIIIVALFFGKTEIKSPLFLIICIIIFIIFMAYLYCIYDPFFHINIKRETPMENMYFYLYILSEKNDFDFVIENKINEHYEKCGICDLCDKYVKYMNSNKQIKDEENETFIKDENNQNNENNKNKLMELFDILYDNKNKYFSLIQKIILTYKSKEKESLNNNNSYFFINLSFLIYSDYQQKNYTLSFNEKLILEVLNQENRSFLDNHESQILQLFLCNEYLSLSNVILDKLKEILNCESNFNKAKQLFELSILLNKLRAPKYKKNLFSHKSENISNSKNLILICSIIYEEIFNTTLNNAQSPIRDNMQSFEDIFHNKSNKGNKIISLSFNLINKDCKIIRAGKGLFSYINDNLFDLFPLIFKEYQINYFMSNILEYFDIGKDIEREKADNQNNSNLTIKKVSRMSLNNLKGRINLMSHNKNKKEYIEIKLILSENISSKMYYKLLTLKIAPLFNSNNPYYILFDGYFYIDKNTVITLKDFEEKKNATEMLIAVSEPELEKNNNIYSIPFKKYTEWQNKQGFIISNVLAFNISVKHYNVYIINSKEKELAKKQQERKSRQIRIEEDEEEEEEEDSIKKTSKTDKMKIMEDNASVTSQPTSTHSTGISSFGIRNKKKDNIYEYGGFNKIKIVNFIAIFIALIVLAIEYIILKSLENSTYNNNQSLLEYIEFIKLYFQLFSSILSVACIKTGNECLHITDVYSETIYNEIMNEYFNYTSLIMAQSIVLAKSNMEKKNYLVNLHKNIGNEKYNELFGKIIDYYKVSQNLLGDNLYLNLTKINMTFSEAILIICNSFQLLVQNPNYPVFFLSGIKEPFRNIQKTGYLSDNEKDFYEMILNYKTYYYEFNQINTKIENILYSKSDFIQVFVYIYITFNNIMLISISFLMYFYCISFELILVKIINFINMTMNIKNDDFNFNSTFSKKIENLESILQFYNIDPIKSVKNLNSIYNDYQEFLTIKNKNNANEMNKKNYNKAMEDDKKNELDNVPKNQRIITRKDVKTLGITFKYIFLFYINIVIVIGLYTMIVILWTNYFSKKKNLFSLIQKNNNLEMSVYKAMNGYNLMIFFNLTIEEMSHYGFSENGTTTSDFLRQFYESLKLAFNSKKEKNNVRDLYQDFEDESNFTCEILYKLNNDYIQKLENNTYGKNLGNISKTLIDSCDFSRISETNDFRTVYERHFQYIRNGILLINDFSYDGLIRYIKEDGTLSKVSLFFNTIIIYLIEIANRIPHNSAINKLIDKLKNLDLISLVIFLCYDIIEILLVIFFYISGINSLCNQIIILRKIFKIFEQHE